MKYDIFLQLDRAIVAFELSLLKPCLYAVQISIRSEVDNWLFDVSSEQGTIIEAEIRRLISYFESHVQKLVNDPNHDSHVFVDQDLLMSVQACCGDIDERGEGGFTLQVMVNPIPFDSNHARLYAGISTVVTIQNIRRFVSSLKMVLANNSH